MQIPLIDLKRQYKDLETAMDEALKKVFDSGRYILGPEVEAFEKEIADYCGVRHAIGVANGTDALVLTLDAAGVGEGDEVVTSPYTFFATTEAISRRGAVPVFVDIDPDTFNINPSLVEEKITSRTKAIIPIHLYGHPADMEPLNDIARRHNLLIIEDACQAIGAEYQGERCGSLADAGCFSFFPTKNLGAFGDGGMVVTDNPVIAEKVSALRTHGSTRKYYHTELGYNSRLDEIQAAILRIKLRFLDSWNKKRCDAAMYYNTLLEGIGVSTPVLGDSAYHVYHLYVIRTSRRDAVMKSLLEQKIGCGIYYPRPLHLQDVYHSLGYKEGAYPESELAAGENLALPLFPEITKAEQQRVVEVVRLAL